MAAGQGVFVVDSGGVSRGSNHKKGDRATVLFCVIRFASHP